MAVVQLSSTNPNFSFMIKKNPNSGMMLKSIRKGKAYGWYSDEATFNVYFKDADNEVSFKQDKNESFEYLNVSRYNSPLFPLAAINEFFKTPLKTWDKRDEEGYEHSLFINMVHIDRIRYIDFFSKHMKGFTFDAKPLTHKSYALTISTKKSLYQLLHVSSVLCLFLSMFGNEYLDISDRLLEKYIQSINVIDAPFYIRSLFVRNFLSSKKRFNKYKVALENTKRYNIQFDFGGTAFQRRNYIANSLPFDKSILDIGCGEGFYAFPFSKKIEESYYAIDIDKELLRDVNLKARSKEINNMITFHSIDHFLEGYEGEQVDIILTEVIEHMSEEEAKDFILQIVKHVNFDNFIITTPNSDFNQYYEINNFRHDDHKWEMGQEQFRQWFIDVTKELNLDYEFVAVGDGVNNIQTTQGVILRNKGA
ncbi:class I SAM-dependent methyltransferase [Chengkuizengella marina]|uniref:Small RNA 2'-O-methyltransferase n=1 Tax=Chengkuizengella marina TaxID=2507566 RepID=A0A6N9Q4U6_9BACL|nr:class I SAM-dependent methyltransferase [Chengkuizengella marina]NBI29875.1 methyltransferase domain-containing protein [Chengkuizengella marina]